MMPLYDYKCTGCEAVFEKNVKMAEYQDPQPCQKCGEKAERTVVGAAIIGDPIRLGITGIPGGFREVLEKIHLKTPGSQLKNNSSYYH